MAWGPYATEDSASSERAARPSNAVSRCRSSRSSAVRIVMTAYTSMRGLRACAGARPRPGTGREGYAFRTVTATMASTTAAATTIPASRATLRAGARMFHGCSAPLPDANARNSAVLRELSVTAELSVLAEKSVSRSDMGMTLADHGPQNGLVRPEGANRHQVGERGFGERAHSAGSTATTRYCPSPSGQAAA